MAGKTGNKNYHSHLEVAILDVLLAFAIVFISLMFCIYKGIFIVYPLLFGVIIFTGLSKKRGFALKSLSVMIWKCSGKSLMIIRMLIYIGAITAVWRASGTVAFIVYYGIHFMNPSLFILYAFLLSSMVSFLLGTCFGTVGTIGIVLMVMAKSGNVNLNAVAGAIIAGAYFGDRCSPMSSCTALVSIVTETELYRNIKNMFKTAYLPFIASVVLYLILSLQNPLILPGNYIGEEILKAFDIRWVTILPAVIILLLAALKVDVKRSMLVSILTGCVIAVFIQHRSVVDILRYILTGYNVENGGFFQDIMRGGGIVSMIKVSLIILVASAYSGIFEGTGMLKQLETFIEALSKKTGIFMSTILTSIAAACFGCSQTLAIILTEQLTRKNYENKKISKYGLAADLANTVVVIAPLIPWNIAGAVPAAALSADARFLPYAFYLYLLPLINWLAKKLREKTYYESKGVPY